MNLNLSNRGVDVVTDLLTIEEVSATMEEVMFSAKFVLSLVMMQKFITTDLQRNLQVACIYDAYAFTLGSRCSTSATP